MQRARNSARLLTAINLLLITGAALLAADLYLARANSLKQNGRWEVTKLQLDRRTMGSAAYFITRTTLAQNQLNLDRYFCYNEVVRQPPPDLARLAFTMRVTNGRGCHLAVGFRRDRFRSSGLLLCGGEGARKSFFYEADPLGLFTERNPVEHRPVFHGKPVRVELTFSDDKVLATIDGKPAGAHRAQAGAGKHVSFRSTGFITDPEQHVVLDDMVFESRGGGVEVETFDNRDALLPLAVMALLAWLGVNLLLWRVGRRWGRYGAKATVLNASALVCLAALHVVDDRVISHRYQDEKQIHWQNLERNLEGEPEMVSRLLAKWKDAAREQVGMVRVLFLGTSQTWGEGASKPEHITAAVTERLLNKRLAERGANALAQVINAGVVSSDSFRLLGAYRDHLLKLKPDIVVAVLGFNDADQQGLLSNLEALVKLNRKEGVRTLVVPEPSSLQWGPPRGNQKEMAALARKLKVPLSEPQVVLDKKLDDGFLWWDGVHLTDGGQFLMAQHLVQGSLGKLVDDVVKEQVASTRATAPVPLPRPAPPQP